RFSLRDYRFRSSIFITPRLVQPTPDREFSVYSRTIPTTARTNSMRLQPQTPDVADEHVPKHSSGRFRGMDLSAQPRPHITARLPHARKEHTGSSVGNPLPCRPRHHNRGNRGPAYYQTLWT